MINTRFILQGLNPDEDHLAAVQEILSMTNAKKIIISTAFMNARGVDLLLDKIIGSKNSFEIYVGVRNGITSKQAIQKLVDNNIYPFCIDTATQAYIFHPKVYLAYNDTWANLLVGSANLTSGGLVKNIEASIQTSLDLSSTDDTAIFNSITIAFETLKTTYPDNVFQLTTQAQVEQLVEEGLLADETVAKPRITAKMKNQQNAASTRKHMKLSTRKLSSTKNTTQSNNGNNSSTSDTTTTSEEMGYTNCSLLWKSAALTERDLCIPHGKNTNPTGSMYLKLGAMSPGTDYQKYFRNKVFSDLTWKYDDTKGKEHLERANAQFRFIIKGIDYGIYPLRLTHNTNYNSKTAMQGNALTSLHWGNASSLIKNRSLLGGTLSIYAPESGSDVFTLVIDID